MSIDDIHEVAQKSTPSDVDVPKSWPALVMWAATKWGIGIIFSAIFGSMLVPVYQDLREANRQLLEITRANVTAMQSLSAAVDRQGREIEKLADRKP